MFDVTDIKRKAIDDADKTMLIYNPLKVDYQGKFDRQELPEYKIPSGENKKIKLAPAKVIGGQLVDLYIADKKNYDRSKAEKLVFPDD